MASNYPPGVTGGEPEIVGLSAAEEAYYAHIDECSLHKADNARRCATCFKLEEAAYGCD